MEFHGFLLPIPGLHFGPQAIQFHPQFPIQATVGLVDDNRPKTQTNSWRCFSGGRSGGSRWDCEKNVNPKQRSRFCDAYSTNEYDEYAEFAFRKPVKQRIWWCDESNFEDDNDDGEDDGGFGILESSIGLNWVFKVFQAFGWMIPAVVISVMFGSGPNTIMMTLALPLAQSAFYLFTDTFLRPNESPKSKRKTKRRSSAGRARARREKQMRTSGVKEARNYESWVVDANMASAKNVEAGPQDFGGWDELDNQVRMEKDKDAGSKNTDEPRVQEGVKISKKVRGDVPLFVRLLTAMFPFWGFWTKLF